METKRVRRSKVLAKKAKKQKKAQTENSTPETGEVKAKGGVNLTVLIPIILVIGIVASVAGTYVVNKFILPPTANAQPEGKEYSGSKISDKNEIVAMDEFLVNLAKGANSNKQQYIKITVSLLVENADESAEVTKNIALVRDTVVNVLRQKKSEEILNNPEGVANLKLELRESINDAYGKGIAKEVFIPDMVIQ